MELQSITIARFRRFAEPATLRTNGKLVALLGPNEAGKTSLLKAISYIGSFEPFEKSDLARATAVDPDDVIVSATFRLESEDLAAASIGHPTLYILEKKASGKLSHRLDPPAPQRDIKHRSRLKADIERIRRNNKLWGRLVQVKPSIATLVDEVSGILNLSDETLSKDHIDKINLLREEAREDTEEKDPAYFRDFSANLMQAIELENAPTPAAIAYDEVFNRVPRFLLFSNDDRLLRGSYTLSELSGDIPPALANIAKVANLDLQQLVLAIKDEDIPNIAQLKVKANEELKARFSESWSQSVIHVAFEVMNEEIQILVQEEGYNFTKLAERSDGLRQFVALQAFTTCERAENPVLLIDEAEMRLHYDAQADLIQMLSKQTVSPKIIYTTHSAGCLPEDLGNGVRLVDYIKSESSATSTIRNHFWDRESGGLEPLLFGMGAATLAFFPIRRALLTEGESDMLLLPTMFRECFNSTSLDFQVVPGLSKTSGINLPILARNGKGIAFALDYDQGGRNIERKIIEAGFEKSSIFFLKGSGTTELQLEDYIDPKLLSFGVDAAFREIGIIKPAMISSSFRSSGRLKAIAAHYGLKKVSEIPKTRIAYAILDSISVAPDRKILDSQKARSFGRLAKNIRAYLSN